MKVKNLLLTFTLLLGASSGMNADNVKVVKPMSIRAGETKTIAVALENAKAYTAFQFDIALPSGMSIEDKSLTSLRTDATHNIKSAVVNGKIRVVAYSANGTTELNADNELVEKEPITVGNKEFTGESGNFILKFNIKASDSFKEGDEDKVEISNILFATNKEGQEMADAKGADGLTVGKVSKDDTINTTDASYILMYLVDNKPDDFNAITADVDMNGTINTADATEILKELVK